MLGRSMARPRSAAAWSATQPVPLSQLIDIVNERFGTDFNQADQLFFDQIVEAAMADDGLRQAAAVNPGRQVRTGLQEPAGERSSSSAWIRTRRSSCGS